MNNGKAWNVRELIPGSEIPSEWSLRSNRELNENVIEAVPITLFCLSLEPKLFPMLQCFQLKSLVLPRTLQDNPLPGLMLLPNFNNLEILEINSIKLSGLMFTGWNFPHLQKLVVNQTTISFYFLEWMSNQQGLESLLLNNCDYDGSLTPISSLLNLNELVLTGTFECLSIDCEFTTSLENLNCFTLEIFNPDESYIEVLSGCEAAIDLTVTTYHTSQIIAISGLSNLASLNVLTPYGFDIPVAFKHLSNLSSISFVDKEIAFDDIDGLHNIPSSLSKLSLDLVHPELGSLRNVLSAFSPRLRELVLKTNTIPEALGLEEFENLQLLDLHARRGFNVDILDKIGRLKQLRHLGSGGSLYIEGRLFEILPSLNLSSFSISNSQISREGLRILNHQQSLKKLSFRCCHFIDFDLNFFPDLTFLAHLTLDNCIPIEAFLPTILGVPQFTLLKFLTIKVSNIGSANATNDFFLAANNYTVITIAK